MHKIWCLFCNLLFKHFVRTWRLSSTADNTLLYVLLNIEDSEVFQTSQPWSECISHSDSPSRLHDWSIYKTISRCSLFCLCNFEYICIALYASHIIWETAGAEQDTSTWGAVRSSCSLWALQRSQLEKSLLLHPGVAGWDEEAPSFNQAYFLG